MGYEILTQEAKGLPEDKLDQAIEFIRFLKFTMNTDSAHKDEVCSARTKNPLADDFVFMSDDFDETPSVFAGYM